MNSLRSRRDLLRAFGVSALAAPFIPTFQRQAEAAGFPRRLLLTFVPNGSLPDYYWPAGGETDFTFKPGSILEPLSAFRQDMVIPKDLRRDWDPPVPDEHEKGIACMYTGAKLNAGMDPGNGFASGPSIDQIIAREINPDTRFKSLQVAVQSDGGPAGKSETMRYMSYAGNNQPIPNENSPYKLFDRLMGTAAGRPPAELAAIRTRRQSVIDSVRAELQDLRKRMGKGEVAKLDGHLEAVRAVEARLQQGGDETRACGGTKPDGTIDLQANDNFPVLMKLQMDLVVSALACDATRLLTWQPSKAYSMTRHRWAGVTGEHHPVSHDLSANGDRMNLAINRWYMQQLAYLLGEMKKIREGDGTLLDNTLVVCGAEQAHGGHHVSNPGIVLLAGKLGGKLRTGRYVDYKKNANWTQMLVSICHAMGATGVQRVGNLGPGGAIPGLFVE